MRCNEIAAIVVVLSDEWAHVVEEFRITNHDGVRIAFAPAGASRQESILNGLEVCATMSLDQKDVVVIHDAARPMVTPELVKACIEGVEGHDGCMPVLGVTDTTYYSEDGSTVAGLLDRDRLFAGQAPEAFLLWPYLGLCRSVSTDELASTRGTSELAVRHGMDVALIAGDLTNFKVTTAEDLKRFRAMIEGEE